MYFLILPSTKKLSGKNIERKKLAGTSILKPKLPSPAVPFISNLGTPIIKLKSAGRLIEKNKTSNKVFKIIRFLLLNTCL